MHYLKEIRLQWGISQSDFADLLGCNRSHLAMAETGKRRLPYAAESMTHRMERTKANQFQPYTAAVAIPDEGCIKALDRTIRCGI